MKAKSNRWPVIAYCAILTLVWAVLASKTFNTKPDLNGDNFNYYIYATSLASGQGYCDLSSPGAPHTSTFPPGYPILMAPLRAVTDSIVAQKWLNELFVLAGVLLLFFALVRVQEEVKGQGAKGGPSKSPCLGGLGDLSLGFEELLLPLVAAAAGLFSPRLWHFSTMMMSEASFFFTSVLVFYALTRMRNSLRSGWLWVMIAALILNYHIRTQGLALVAAVLLLLLCQRRWLSLGTTVVGFALGCLPYMLRNKMLGLNGNRYVDSIMLSNPFQPDAGTLTVPEVIERFFQTLKMLVFNAIPNTIFPYLNVNCDQPSFSTGIYITGALVLAVILIGYWHAGSLRWGLIGYLFATLGLISLFSTPSGNRYLTSVLPILAAGLMLGLYFLISRLVVLATKKDFSKPLSIILPLLLALTFIGAKDGIQEEVKLSKQKYPLQYVQFFNMGKQLKKIAPEGTVVCSRKPQMFWIESGLPGVNYKYTKDAKELLSDLAQKEVDYVVLDALGYSSTYLYLFPAVQQYATYFPQVVAHYDNTGSYLIRFDRQRWLRDNP